jgi:hypothetical protein
MLGGIGAVALAVGILPASGAVASPPQPAGSTAPSGALEGWGPTASRAGTNQSVTNRIDTDGASLATQGVQLTEWGPDPASGKVKIYLTHYTDAARLALQARYGSDVVVATESMPRPTPLSRSNDTSPFWGGDFITTPLGGCTSGPTVVGNASGINYMLTAGHCARVGDVIKTHGVTMGTVTNRRLCSPCIDSETVNGSYGREVWGGGSTSSTFYYEDGALFAQPNQGSASLVTNDSAYTGELRGIAVQAVNQSVTFTDGITRRYLTRVYKNGQVIVHAGDSGGPWIQHEGSTAYVKVVGTTVGGICNAQGACTTGWYQQITAIENFFNVHVP